MTGLKPAGYLPKAPLCRLGKSTDVGVGTTRVCSQGGHVIALKNMAYRYPFKNYLHKGLRGGFSGPLTVLWLIAVFTSWRKTAWQIGRVIPAAP